MTMERFRLHQREPVGDTWRETRRAVTLELDGDALLLTVDDDGEAPATARLDARTAAALSSALVEIVAGLFARGQVPPFEGITAACGGTASGLVVESRMHHLCAGCSCTCHRWAEDTPHDEPATAGT